MVIRRLTKDDLDDCVSLYVATFNAPPWNKLSWRFLDATQRLGDFIATPQPHGVLATDSDDEPMGFALGCLERSETEDHILLKQPCVRTEIRGKDVTPRSWKPWPTNCPKFDTGTC